MINYKFPTDAEFRKKAAYIADKVMYAINVKNVRIASVAYYSNKNYCPLGCLDLEKQAHYPNSALATLMSNGILSWDDCSYFIDGFSGLTSGPTNPMVELGKAYRERFIK